MARDGPLCLPDILRYHLFRFCFQKARETVIKMYCVSMSTDPALFIAIFVERVYHHLGLLHFC